MPQDKQMQSERWAKAALNAALPDVQGMDYEIASRCAVSLCREAAETGQTFKCAEILPRLVDQMKMRLQQLPQ